MGRRDAGPGERNQDGATVSVRPRLFLFQILILSPERTPPTQGFFLYAVVCQPGLHHHTTVSIHCR